MKYVKLGNTGAFVSVLGFGAMTIGDKTVRNVGTGVGQEVSDKLIKLCIDKGINLFDTADAYDGGNSEVVLGKSLKDYRSQVLIATKVRGRTGTGINERGLSRRHMMIGLRNSMERLRTDWIDIYQYHGWDFQANVEEMIQTMQFFVDQGLVIYPAFSNFTAWQMAYIQGIVEERGYAKYQSAQVNYNLMSRDVEYETIPFLKYSKMTLISWSPLHGGLLSGKYRKGEEAPPGTRLGDGGYLPVFDEEKGWAIVNEVKRIADELGVKPSQVALSWLAEKNIVILISARNIEHLKEDIDSIDIVLKREQVDRLNKISQRMSFELIYPNWIINKQNKHSTEGFNIVEAFRDNPSV